MRVREQTAEPRVVEVVLRGQTMANRQVELRAETRAKVVAVPADKGSLVRTDDVIARLSDDDRQARLAQARALLAQRQIEYDNAQKLSKKGYRAETDVAAALAQLQEAKAAVASMEIDIGYTTIRVPFDGVVEERPVEIGDFLDVGETVATIVDLDPMLVVGHVTEQDVVTRGRVLHQVAVQLARHRKELLDHAAPDVSLQRDAARRQETRNG